MDNFIFSINATLPIFLTMVLGLVFRKAGVFDDAFTNKMNSFVFKFALPALLFEDLWEENFYQAWDGGFVLFCFCATLGCILVSTILSSFLKEKSDRGEFIQASYRSSAAILGIAFIVNIYGQSGMAPLMIIGTVPLYNICAVAALTLTSPTLTSNVLDTSNRAAKNSLTSKSKASAVSTRDRLLRTAKGIITNPIILGIAAGFAWSLLKLPHPVILQKTVHNLGVLATPLGLMAMGASFDIKKAFYKLKPAIVCTVLKLVGYSGVLMPVAIALGYRNEALVAILVMLGSATTVSSYTMAKSMGHEGTLSASVVMLTTLLSAFTLTGWLFLLKTLSLI